MEMSGEQQVAAPRESVWQALNDPDVLRQCIPGCQSLEKDGDGFRAVAEIKIGPIGARFSGTVTLSDLDPPKAYRISGQGNGGMAGSAKGGATVRLAEQGDVTILTYRVEAQVSGRLAQLGGPIIDATAKQLAARFFRRFDEVVTGKSQSAAAPAAPSSVEAPQPVAGPQRLRANSGGAPMVWVLAIVVAALAGFLIGSSGGDGDGWAGLAIGLLVIVVAGAAFEHGRRSGSHIVTIDEALAAKLLGGGK